MTKAQYFEMCEMLSSEPINSEIPVEIDDFPELVQTAFTLYYMLRDIWDPMGGNYMGKDMSSIFDFFDLYEIDKSERLLMLTFIRQMDGCRSKVISDRQKAREASSKKA